MSIFTDQGNENNSHDGTWNGHAKRVLMMYNSDCTECTFSVEKLKSALREFLMFHSCNQYMEDIEDMFLSVRLSRFIRAFSNAGPKYKKSLAVFGIHEPESSRELNCGDERQLITMLASSHECTDRAWMVVCWYVVGCLDRMDILVDRPSSPSPARARRERSGAPSEVVEHRRAEEIPEVEIVVGAEVPVGGGGGPELDPHAPDAPPAERLDERPAASPRPPPSPPPARPAASTPPPPERRAASPPPPPARPAGRARAREGYEEDGAERVRPAGRARSADPVRPEVLARPAPARAAPARAAPARAAPAPPSELSSGPLSAPADGGRFDPIPASSPPAPAIPAESPGIPSEALAVMDNIRSHVQRLSQLRALIVPAIGSAPERGDDDAVAADTSVSHSILDAAHSLAAVHGKYTAINRFQLEMLQQVADDLKRLTDASRPLKDLSDLIQLLVGSIQENMEGVSTSFGSDMDRMTGDLRSVHRSVGLLEFRSARAHHTAPSTDEATFSMFEPLLNDLTSQMHSLADIVFRSKIKLFTPEILMAWSEKVKDEEFPVTNIEKETFNLPQDTVTIFSCFIALVLSSPHKDIDEFQYMSEMIAGEWDKVRDSFGTFVAMFAEPGYAGKAVSYSSIPPVGSLLMKELIIFCGNFGEGCQEILKGSEKLLFMVYLFCLDTDTPCAIPDEMDLDDLFHRFLHTPHDFRLNSEFMHIFWKNHELAKNVYREAVRYNYTNGAVNEIIAARALEYLEEIRGGDGGVDGGGSLVESDF